MSARPKPKHLYSLGEAREHAAIERLMYVECAALLAAMGLPGGWWCAIELPRTEVFGDGMSGDVDLIAGPLEFNFDEAGWVRRLNVESALHRLSMPRGVHVNTVARKAAAEGCIVWPPRTDTVVACEVKASLYRDGGWRPTYKGRKRHSVAGQLRYLVKHGVDRVMLANICATRPRSNRWAEAGSDARSAFDSARPMFPADELPGCGYCVSVFGAIEQEEEGLGGSIIGPHVLLPPLPNTARDGDRPWRSRLRERLGAMPPPPFVRTFVLRCAVCGMWRHAASAATQGNPCTCSQSARA